MRKRSEGTVVPKWRPLDHCCCFGEGNGNGARKSKAAGQGWISLPALSQARHKSAVRKAGSQPLSLQHIGISSFKTMRLGFFG